MPRRRLAGHLALVLVQIFFGLFPLLAKWALAAFSPAAIAGWRMVFGGVVFMLLAAGSSGRSALPRLRDLPLLLACALLGVVFNQLLFLEGLSRSSAVNAGLLIPLIPVYTLLIAVIVRQERFIAGRALGIAIAFAGAAQLLLRKDPELGRAHLLGNALFALNAFIRKRGRSRWAARRCSPSAGSRSPDRSPARSRSGATGVRRSSP